MRGKSATVLAGVMLVGALIGAAPVQAATMTQVVRTLTVNTWFGGNEGPGGSLGNASLVQGPDPAPAGVGSAALEVDSTGRASLGTNQFAGTRLDQINALDYWGYVAGSPGNQLVLQFDIDYDATDNDTFYRGRLVFSPSTNPPPDTWRHLDALADGKWWASQAPGNAVCSQASMCTWAEVLTAFPDAAVRNDSIQRGAFLFRLGGPVPGGATAFVDLLNITIGSDTTMVDFEPGGTVTPTIGPMGTTVTATGYELKPKAPMTVYYATNVGKRKVKLCRVKAGLNGVAQCVGTIPTTAKKAGPAGVHAITLSSTKSRPKVNYVADFVLTP